MGVRAKNDHGIDSKVGLGGPRAYARGTFAFSLQGTLVLEMESMQRPPFQSVQTRPVCDCHMPQTDPPNSPPLAVKLGSPSWHFDGVFGMECPANAWGF